MTAILIYVGIWAAVAVAITLLLGRYFGRRPRFPSPLACANPPERGEGWAHPGVTTPGEPPSDRRDAAPYLTGEVQR